MSNMKASCACGMRGKMTDRTTGSSRWSAMVVQAEASYTEHASNWWYDPETLRYEGVCYETGRRWRS